MISLTIDGFKVEVEEGATILEAARQAKVHIPTLCYLPEVQAIGACRVCLVEIEGNRTLQAACVFAAAQGLVVYTNTEKVRKARKFSVEMLLSNHPFECLTCARNLNCELQSLASELGIREVRFNGEHSSGRIDESSPSIRRDQNKCILCRRCVTVCQEIQSVTALYAEDCALTLRKSHESPSVKKLYEEFLGAPLGEKSHHLLHTHYTPRSKF